MHWSDQIDERQRAIADKVAAAADRHGVPRELALAIARQESSFNQNKKSPTGPVGVMQLGHKAAKDMNVNRHNEDQNIEGGVKYAGHLLNRFGGDVDKALIAYHDGPNSEYFQGGQMSPEAQNYVKQVKGYAGMAGPSKFNTSVEDIEPVSFGGDTQSGAAAAAAPQASAFDPNMADVGLGFGGGAVGAYTGADRSRRQSNIDAQIANARRVESQNKEARAAHAAEIAEQNRQYQYMLELRKHAMDAAEARQKGPGFGTRNWMGSEFGGDISDVEGSKVLSKPEAVEAGNRAVSNIRKAESMMPGVHADPVSKLWLPSSVPARTAPVAPDPFPMPPLPARPPMPTQQQVPAIVTGSHRGTLGNTIGGAIAGQQAGRAIQDVAEGDVAGAGLSGLTSVGSGMTTWGRSPKTKLVGGAIATGAGGLNALRNWWNEHQAEVPQKAEGGMVPGYSGAKGSLVKKISATVMRPQRVAYPEIYQDPRLLVGEAASRVAPEDPLLKRLFNVSREDLWDISQQGTRKGNITERPFKAAANAKGAAHAGEVMNPRNVQRLQNIIGEAQQRPELYKGMASWYTMDPLYQRFVEIYGPDKAVDADKKFNTLTGMASPGSEVMTELNRGTAANYLSNQGRFEDFKKFGGQAGRGPEDMNAVMGHPYHSTAQSGPMEKYLSSGLLDMGSAKVPSYIHASGVPETGFQTSWPVGDAHWSRLVGLPDVRGARTIKGREAVPNASASVPEMTALGPWWKDEVAAPMGLEAVPAQAVVWGAGSGATGVTSPIGAGKLELLSRQIGSAAERMGVTPETARDMIIQGKAYAGGLPTK